MKTNSKKKKGNEKISCVISRREYGPPLIISNCISGIGKICLKWSLLIY